jgi:putative MATE family efflux protein
VTDSGAKQTRPAEEPHFVTGSTMRHVLVMASTGTVGLIAIFVVDFLSLLYISWLGDPRLTAGVGLATIVLFLTVSINVGLMIAVGALVSKALGAGDRDRARRLAASTNVHMALTSAVVSLALLPFLPALLRLLGASADTLPVALEFLWIVLPTNILMALGMGFSGVLRAVGDARRAMYVTLVAAVATAILDPLFIFGFGLGPNGAAMAIAVSRVIFVLVGYHGAVRVHRLVARPQIADAIADAKSMFAIAVPAILTNVATPIANAFFVSVIAPFGDDVIAAVAVIDRLVPVAFGGLFALSGAIGPILAQNWGALRFDRMRMALRDAALVMSIYVGVVWLLLALLRSPIASLFNAEGATEELVQFFCLICGFMWFFVGLLFVSNASFNNLGFPLFSTAFNWARATLGMAPFALIGAYLGGPKGALIGIGAGSIPFGIAAILTAFWTIRRLERNATEQTVAYADADLAEARSPAP